MKVGVWEQEKFIGVIIFSLGACAQIGRPFGLEMTQVCELTRVALTKHECQVSQVLAKAIQMLRDTNPGLQLIVSYADANQGHHGGIYQATNWIYIGDYSNQLGIRLKGKLVHPRSVSSRYGIAKIDWLQKHVDPNAERVRGKPKHKYIMPLNKKARRQVKHLSKPYPSRLTNDKQEKPLPTK